MNTDVQKIKRNTSLLPSLLFFSFILIALSVYCLLFPVFKQLNDEKLEIVFYIVGAIGTVCFVFMLFNYLFQLIFPKNAIIIDNNGFYDLTVAGIGAGFVEWSNVANISVFSVDKKRFMGISLNEPSTVLNDCPRSVEKLIIKNANESLPEIIIKQSDIAISLDRLNTIFKSNTVLTNQNHKDNNNLSIFEETITYDIEKSKNLTVSTDTKELSIDALFEKPQDFVAESVKEATEEMTEDDIYINSHIESEALKTTDNITSEAEPVQDNSKNNENDASIEELLSSLSQSLKNNQEKIDNSDKKDLSKDIEELIKLLKNNKE
ncbi:hypothetical protein LJB90_03820 [Eubacteriales bacterium OttesenSCG-928-G02]|nr:hypothetical protein [Eubacteriales bacterium OttesenSCG-928-G02]